MKCSDINFRDPFIVPVVNEGLYYMYGTIGKSCWGGPVEGFDVYFSPDLDDWEGPLAAFRPPAGFWADRNFWAPEAHFYDGKYYMFASFKAEGVNRGTQILVSDSPRGPFRLHSDGPVTPGNWECLDGTLYIDLKGMPWIVFCHEWVQVNDGEVCAIPLSTDLSSPVGEPILLFRASEASWVKPINEAGALVTDGPFMYRTATGALLLIWSGFGTNGYTVGIARSADGDITGPWIQEPTPLYDKDGGHAMVFRTFNNRLMLSFHTPNKTPFERPIWIPLIESGDLLVEA